jgi:molecular chaperone IbpA
MTTLRTITTADLAQLSRALVGFDRIFANRLNAPQASNYPPHNVVKLDETHYCIEVAVAGFKKEEISVHVDQDQLIIRGASQNPSVSATREYLHRGLAARDFVIELGISEHIQVVGAEVKDGLLNVDLEYIIPEALKPRQIIVK